MRVQIKYDSGEKTGIIHINDLEACAKAKGLDPKDVTLLSEMHDLIGVIHDAQPDAGAVELTPDNIARRC